MPARTTTSIAMLGAAAALLLQACAAGRSGQARAAGSSLACMRESVAVHVPRGIPDGRAHCLAAAFIARECSTAESWLASYAKELRDLLGAGDAEFRDLAADRAGVHCARAAQRDEDVEACCLGRFGEN